MESNRVQSKAQLVCTLRKPNEAGFPLWESPFFATMSYIKEVDEMPNGGSGLTGLANVVRAMNPSDWDQSIGFTDYAELISEGHDECGHCLIVEAAILLDYDFQKSLREDSGDYGDCLAAPGVKFIACMYGIKYQTIKCIYDSFFTNELSLEDIADQIERGYFGS